MSARHVQTRASYFVGTMGWIVSLPRHTYSASPTAHSLNDDERELCASRVLIIDAFVMRQKNFFLSFLSSFLFLSDAGVQKKAERSLPRRWKRCKTACRSLHLSLHNLKTLPLALHSRKLAGSVAAVSRLLHQGFNDVYLKYLSMTSLSASINLFWMSQ